MIVKARDKPILSMLEWIKVRLMSRLYIKKSSIEKYGGNLCPSIPKKLEQLKLECKSFYAIPSGSLCIRLTMREKGMWWTW